MNREPFGGNASVVTESEHIAGEMKSDDVYVAQLKSMYDLLPSLEAKLERKDCKIRLQEI